MKRSPLKRKTQLTSNGTLKRSPMQRKRKGKAAKRREFSQEIRWIVMDRSGGVCEWCLDEWITNIHHCKFRSQLTKEEGSGGLANALGLGDKCDALVHGGKEGQKYRRLFAERAKQLAEGHSINA